MDGLLTHMGRIRVLASRGPPPLGVSSIPPNGTGPFTPFAGGPVAPVIRQRRRCTAVGCAVLRRSAGPAGYSGAPAPGDDDNGAEIKRRRDRWRAVATAGGPSPLEQAPSEAVVAGGSFPATAEPVRSGRSRRGRLCQRGIGSSIAGSRFGNRRASPTISTEPEARACDPAPARRGGAALPRPPGYWPPPSVRRATDSRRAIQGAPR